MSRRIPRREEEHRRSLVSDLERSGQSVIDFARERGISPWSLYRWRRRLAGDPAPVCAAKPDFVQVTIKATPAPRSAIQIELERGVRVNVPAGFDEGELRRLLEVLASC